MVKRLLIGLAVAAALVALRWIVAERSPSVRSAQDAAAREEPAGDARDAALAVPAESDPAIAGPMRTTIEGRAVLAGKVVWGSGAYAGFCVVEVRSERDASFARELRTDGFGNFRLEVPDRGPFRVAAERTKARHGVGVEHVVCRAFADGVCAPVDDLRLTLAAPCEVRGRVLGPDRNPPRAFHVIARHMDELGRTRSTVAEEFMPRDGRFGLVLPDAGPWEVHAEAACFVASQPVTRSVAGVVGDVELVLGATATVRGLVLDPDGRPILGARVGGGEQVADLDFANINRDKTDRDGAFALGCLNPGAQKVWADCEGYAPSEPVELELASGAERDGLVLTLRRGASIEALVRFAHPSASRSVQAELVARSEPRRRWSNKPERTTDPTVAKLSLVGLPTGAHQLIVRIRDELGTRQLSEPVELADGVALALELDDDAVPRVLVSGRITANGKPLAGWPIRFVSPSWEYVAEAKSDASGRYELKLSQPGDWEVRSESIKCDLATTIVVPDVERWTYDLELGGARILGRVVGPQGPPEACRLELSSEPGPIRFHAMASARDDGGFEFESVPAGTYTVTTYDPRFSYAGNGAWLAVPLEHVVVRAGEVVEGLELVVVAAARVIVTLRGAESGFVGGWAEASGRTSSLETAVFTSSDRRATARFDQLPAGELRIFAACGERFALSGWFTLDTGATRELTLDLEPAARIEVELDSSESAPELADYFVAAPGGSERTPVSWEHDEEGEHFGAMLPPGAWEFVVVLADERTVRQPFTARAGEPTRVVVRVE